MIPGHHSSADFLSELFSKVKLEKLLVHKEYDNVISMGLLPSFFRCMHFIPYIYTIAIEPECVCIGWPVK